MQHQVSETTMFKIHALLILGSTMLAACGGNGLDPMPGSTKACGNGIVEAGEECDLGSRFNADSGACRSDCRTAYCGDGFTGPDEVCDDANNVDDDDCTNLCGAPILCGNGHTDADAGEECDDANDGVADSCLPNCKLASCGDGEKWLGVEQCDDGVHNSDFTADACRTSCLSAYCGDRVVDEAEACDNGSDNSNVVPDACRENCTLPSCGDGVVDNGEECDDGSANSSTVPDACRTDCTAPVCGDGVADSNENCDDAGDSDTCDVDCSQAECGDGYPNAANDEQCDDAGESPSCDVDCTEQRCGDGVINAAAGEECDVGWSFPNGACTLDCQLACTGTYGDCTAAVGCETDLYTSGEHCGACGHDCGGGACVFGECSPIKIADLGTLHLVTSIGLKEHDGDIYATTSAGLSRVSATARGLTQPTLFPNVSVAFRSFTFSDEAVLFFPYGSDVGLHAVPFDTPTASPTHVADGEWSPVLESDGQYIFGTYVAEGRLHVERLAIGGSSFEEVGSTPDIGAQVAGFDMIIQGAQLYTGATVLSGSEVWRFNKTPSDPFPTFLGASANSLDMASDANYIYWPNSSEIRRVNKNAFACLPAPVCPSDSFTPIGPNVISIAADTAYVYWGEPTALRRKGVSAGSAEDFVSGLAKRPTAMLLTQDFIFWVVVNASSSGSFAGPGPGELWKMAR